MCLTYLDFSIASFHGCEALGQDDRYTMCPVPLGISIMSPFPVKECLFSFILLPSSRATNHCPFHPSLVALSALPGLAPGEG